MTENAKTLTTGEFSKITGIAVSSLTLMLRQGRIRGEKRSGKWAIDEKEVQNTVVLSKQKAGKSSTDLGPIFDAPVAAGKTYNVETFSQMTYLTRKGVRQWLETGRLSGGKGMVDAANLDRPGLKHLIRK